MVRKTRRWKPGIWRWAALVTLLFAAGCDGGFPIQFPAKTARDAAIQRFQQDARRRKANIDWNTVNVLQQQVVQEDIVFVLLSFQEIRKNGQPMNCLYYYGTQRNDSGWSADGGGGGCSATGQVPLDGSPIEAGRGGGWSRDPQGLTFSIAEGFVFSNRVAGVDITWEDDVKQRAEVVNQSYMAVRLEVHQVKRFEALDADGNIVYTYTP